MAQMIRHHGRTYVDRDAVNRMVHSAARVDDTDVEVSAERSRELLPEVERMAAAERGEMVYDQDTGQGATPVVVRDYQREGQDRLAGYVSNPFEAEGRERMGRQLWEAPLGGHVRSVLEGQDLFGHRVTRGQARVAEQAAAGLLATGVGVPMFLEAVRGLTTPQTQGTIPMS